MVKTLLIFPCANCAINKANTDVFKMCRLVFTPPDTYLCFQCLIHSHHHFLGSNFSPQLHNKKKIPLLTYNYGIFGRFFLYCLWEEMQSLDSLIYFVRIYLPNKILPPMGSDSEPLNIIRKCLHLLNSYSFSHLPFLPPFLSPFIK